MENLKKAEDVSSATAEEKNDLVKDPFLEIRDAYIQTLTIPMIEKYLCGATTRKSNYDTTVEENEKGYDVELNFSVSPIKDRERNTWSNYKDEFTDAGLDGSGGIGVEIANMAISLDTIKDPTVRKSAFEALLKFRNILVSDKQ